MTLTQIKPLGLSKPVDLADNEKIRLGTGNDLEIYHDGSASEIKGTTGYTLLSATNGSLYLDGNSIYLRSGAGNENYIKCIDDGAVELYYDNQKALKTTDNGILVYGHDGDAAALYIYADDGDQLADRWALRADASSSQFKLRNIASGSWEDCIVANGDGSVELYHDNSKKFETTSSGIKVIDKILIDGSTTDIEITSNQFKFNRDAATSYIDQYGTGAIALRTTPSGSQIERLHITSGGDVRMPADSVKLQLGASQDLEIYHDGSHSYIKDSGTGNLILQTSKLNINNADNTKAFIHTSSADGVELYFDGAQKLATYADGVILFNSGTSARISFNAASGDRGYVYASNANNIGFLDSNADWLVKGTKDAGVELHYDGSKKFETTSDGVKIDGGLLEIAHTSCHIDFMETSTTNHRLRNGSGNFQIQNISDDKSSTTTNFLVDGGTGAVELYFNGSKKVETDTNGAVLTGRLRVEKSGDTSINVKDSSSNAVSAYVEVKTAGRVEYNCYKEGVGTKYPHVFMGYTEEYGRIDAAGIKFNGDTATANALSDYEEGTWTPAWGTYAGSGQTDGTFTYHAQQGQYIKIGRHVTCWFYIAYHEMSAVAVGSYARIKGFPFTVGTLSTSHNSAPEGSTIIINWQNWKGNSAQELTGFAHRNQTHVLFGHKTANGINAATPGEMFTNSTWGPVSSGTYYLFGQLTYVTD